MNARARTKQADRNAKPAMTVWRRLQTGITVTIIAALLWLFAESEGVKQKEMIIDVEFVPPPGRELVIEPTRPRTRITLVVRGNAQQLARLESLRQPFQLQVSDDPTGQSSRRDIDLADALSRHDPIAELGMAIIETRPASFNIRVERYETRELPIDVQIGEGSGIIVNGDPDPARITIRLPASDLALIADETRALAVPSREALSALTPNRPYKIDVPTQLPASLQGRPYVHWGPATTKVDVTVHREEKEAELSLPIYVIVSPLDMGRYEVHVEPSTVLVKLRGPTELLERVQEERSAWAELRLSTDALETSIDKTESVNPKLRLPEGVSIAEPAEPVQYEVHRVTRPEATGTITTPVPVPVPVPPPATGLPTAP